MEKVTKVKWKYKSTPDDEREEDRYTHIQLIAFGYETLCGLGSEGVGNAWRKEPNHLIETNRKVDCQHCLLMYNFCKSTTL